MGEDFGNQFVFDFDLEPDGKHAAIVYQYFLTGMKRQGFDIASFDLDSLIEDGDFLFYRKHLKVQVSELETPTNPRPLKDAWGFSLNMLSENKGS